MFKQTLVLALAVVALTGAGGAPTTEVFQGQVDTRILPHRALYNITLDSVKNGSTVSGAEGKMFFQWADACTGWTVEQRFDLNFSYNEAENSNINTTYTTWESKDGSQYRFNVRRMTNGKVEEAYKGSASIPAPGKAGKAYFVVPEETEVAIPAGTLFPTAHTKALLAAANDHKPMFTATVFDGSEGEGLSEISAVIGLRKLVPTPIAKAGRDQQPDVMWPVRMAFYKTDSQEPEPEYEMDSTMLPNGVTESMILDYGEFRLKATLEKLETLPAPKC